MTRRTVVLSVLLAVWLTAESPRAEDALRREFLSPPDSAKAWCYWWWLNGAASKEGITRDFEEMKKQGIAGALLFDAGEAGPEAPRGPHFMSDPWRDLYQHAVREADRCGIALGVNLCSGWNCGGAWVTQQHAAKKLVSAQTIVKGPGRATVALPQPPAVQGYYGDVVVLAVPVPEDDLGLYKLLASSQYRDYSPALAEDAKEETRWISNGDQPGMGPTPEKPEFLQFAFDQPGAAAGGYLRAYSDCGPKDVEVQCSDDGQTFRALTRATLKPREERTLAFAETRARHFRVLFPSSHPYRDGNWNVQVAEIALLSKTQLADKKPPARFLWDRSRTLDLTRFVDHDGKLDWEVPAGSWKVLRVGSALHGNPIKCVGSGPTGLEIDVMSAEAMDAHFAETGAKLIADAGPLAGKTLQYFHIDSWELGQPTWTPRMREEFQRRRGYDPTPWLPAVLGQTVDSAAETARFLQDFRRTAADLVAANYYGRLRELTRQGGLRGTHPESGGPFFTHWIDALQCAGINDVPMGEFWKRNHEPDGPITHRHNPSLKQAASAMHTYGKRDCQAEAYTSFAADWIDDPWTMKDIGDAAFCEGLTRNVLCFWVHQSRLDAKPGFQWAHVGTHFDCHLTWWPMSGAWLTYLARCQHLLRQGLFVADIAYLQNEAIPSFIPPRPNQRLAGFDYDVLNAEVLLTRASAENGRLVLPDGMSYRYLVLPPQADAVLAPATLKKVNELSQAGVAVIGPQTLAESVTKLREGPLEAVLRADGLAPDIEFREPSVGANFDWIHRRDGETEIYFVSNQSPLDAAAQVAFRVAGRQPELWDAVTGSVRDLPVYRQEDGRTIVRLQFAPRQSWFVVFRKPASGAGVPDSGSNFPAVEPVLEVTGAWQVQFDPSWFYPNNGTGGKVPFEKLEDWTQRPEEAIKYYSGIAVYRKTFEVPSEIQNPKSKTYLSLGAVKNVARVRLNGRDLGVVWTAPWRVEITGALKPGANDLEIEVANLWPNRLIGDAKLPQQQRRTVTNVRTYDTTDIESGRKSPERKNAAASAGLLPAGLLGPVRVVREE